MCTIKLRRIVWRFASYRVRRKSTIKAISSIALSTKPWNREWQIWIRWLYWMREIQAPWKVMNLTRRTHVFFHVSWMSDVNRRSRILSWRKEVTEQRKITYQNQTSNSCCHKMFQMSVKNIKISVYLYERCELNVVWNNQWQKITGTHMLVV